jgi:universal stress protein A
VLTIRTILHPTDFSEHSDYALQFASLLAHDSKAKLFLLHVDAPPVAAYVEPIPDLVTEAHKQEAKKKLLAIHPAFPGIQYEHVFLQGDPASSILQVAQEKQCELIVMSSHGRTGLGRLLLGSVAEQVMRKAPCPVLVVKKPQPEQPVPVREVLAHAPAVP